MGLISQIKNWLDNENVTFTDLNGMFDTVYNLVNGNLDNNNIKAGAAIAESKLAYDTASGHCFSLDTELLTKDGFKYRKDIKEGDLVLTINEKLEGEYQPVEKLFDYKAKDFKQLCRLHNTHTDLLVTGEHGLIS